MLLVDDLLVSQPSSGEEALQICEMLVRSNAIDIVVLDSVAALVTRQELAGEIGTLDRFPKQSSFSIYIGMAPLDNQSGTYRGTKSPKHVNTRARKAMMTAVFHHISCVPESRAYYEKKRSEGKSHNKAVRALGRHISNVSEKQSFC